MLLVLKTLLVIQKTKYVTQALMMAEFLNFLMNTFLILLRHRLSELRKNVMGSPLQMYKPNVEGH
nr:hypothetical protein Iba_chr03cCG7130 [Ipomoea batatas]